MAFWFPYSRPPTGWLDWWRPILSWVDHGVTRVLLVEENPYRSGMKAMQGVYRKLDLSWHALVLIIVFFLW